MKTQSRHCVYKNTEEQSVPWADGTSFCLAGSLWINSGNCIVKQTVTICIARKYPIRSHCAPSYLTLSYPTQYVASYILPACTTSLFWTSLAVVILWEIARLMHYLKNSQRFKFVKRGFFLQCLSACLSLHLFFCLPFYLFYWLELPSRTVCLSETMQSIHQWSVLTPLAAYSIDFN